MDEDKTPMAKDLSDAKRIVDFLAGELYFKLRQRFADDERQYEAISEDEREVYREAVTSILLNRVLVERVLEGI